MNGNRAVAPGIIELMAAIGNKHEIDAEPSSGFVEAAGLVAEFGGEDEESRHLLLFEGLVFLAHRPNHLRRVPVLLSSSRPVRWRQTARALARRSSTTAR